MLMTSHWTNEDFPMEVFIDEEENSMLISWDETHPVTSVFNDWTEDDFVAMIMEACKTTLGNGE